MRFAAVVKINEDNSVGVPEALRRAVGFENDSKVYFQLVESKFYQRVDKKADEITELWCFVSSVDPEFWIYREPGIEDKPRLFDVELRLGNERGSLATATEILRDNGISIVMGESHTYLCQVRAQAHLILWFENFEGDVDDLNKVFEDAIKNNEELRKSIKPVKTSADRETWVEGGPSKLTNYAFKKVFAPGTAGRSGEDNPIFLPREQRWSDVDEGRVIIPEDIIKNINKMFQLPNKQFKSVAGSSYVIMEADSQIKALKLTFPSPDSRIVTIQFLTFDRPGSVAAIGRMLSDKQVNLLQTWIKSLSFRQEGSWTVIADVKGTGYEKIFPEPALAEEIKKDMHIVVPNADEIIKDVKVQFHPPLPATMEHPFRILIDLETKIRILIEKELRKKYGSDWWEKGVPQEVIGRAMDRKERELRQFIAERRDIEYLDFVDYMKVISENWKSVFKGIFPSKNWINTRLSELIPIRNKTMHATPLNNNELKRLDLDYNEIYSLIHNRIGTA